MTNKITREEIKNLVEYSMQLKEDENKDVKELVNRLDVEFKSQWKLCKEKYQTKKNDK